MIYGFVAPKGFGKTEACKIVKKNILDVGQVNFKDALIEELKEYFPDFLQRVLEEHAEYSTIDDLFVHKPPVVRKLMQWWGTDVRREEDEDYWINEWVAEIYNFAVPIDVVTDDVRFVNEAEAIKDMGGVLIRLERPDLLATDKHKSETEQASITTDYTITCVAGELDKLEHELVKIIIREQT